MKIEKDRIIIRDASEEDAEKVASWWNDGEVMAHVGFPDGLGVSVEEVRNSIIRSLSDSSYQIIEIDGVPAGELSHSDTGEGICEIGIKICDRTFQDKGLGKKILSLYIKDLFSSGFKKIVLDTNLENKRAQHVYERLGFRMVRINKDSWEDQKGRLQSSVDYELVPESFRFFS